MDTSTKCISKRYANQHTSKRSTSSDTGLTKVERFLSLITESSTLRTRPSSLLKTLSTIPVGQSFRAQSLSLIKTKSPGLRSRHSLNHFSRFCRECRYSSFHLRQNSSARTCTCFQCDFSMSFGLKSGNGPISASVFMVSKVDGVKTQGDSESLETGSKGRLFTIAETLRHQGHKNFIGEARALCWIPK